MHVIGTAGHVDHGKSALVEKLTGIDPDRFEEEKRRGLTIDLGFAWLALPSGTEIGLIDVPGHERFIKNMLAGAGGITVCLFVVAANEGWMPQSSEHLAILDILGISGGVIALTKSDLVDEEGLELARAEIGERVAGTVLEDAPVVACSAVTGAGLDELVAALDRVIAGAPGAPDEGRPRLWVDRVFTVAGAGTVVTGTLAGGSFSAGDAVEISPEGRRARVRGIQSHKRAVERIGPGNRTALNLAGLERQGAERGDAVVRADQWRPTRTIDVFVRVLPESLAGRTHELTEKGSHLLYAGSAETPVRVKLLDRKAVAPGENAFAQLHLRDVLPLARGDRFVLRDAGRILTFGGGEILDPLPRPVGRHRHARIATLTQLHGADPLAALTTIVAAEGQVPVGEAALRTGGAGGAGATGVERLADVYVSGSRFDELAGTLRDVLSRHHAEKPLERGLARETARAALDLEPAVFDALVDRVSEVTPEGAGLRLTSHTVALDPQQAAARDRVVAMIEGAGFTPPLASELTAEPALLRALVESGDLVRIGDFFLTKDQAAEARANVRARIEEGGGTGITVAEIRDLLGTSRKYAVPLCEWLDQTGATIRRGDLRLLGPHP